MLAVSGDDSVSEERVDLDEWVKDFRRVHGLDDDDGDLDVGHALKLEQRLLVMARRYERRFRLAIDLHSFPAANNYHVLPNSLRPLKNQSRRWLFLFDIKTATLEVRDAADGAVIISAEGAGGDVYESGRGPEDVIDLDAVNYFDADDFSIVFSSITDNVNSVAVLDFF